VDGRVPPKRVVVVSSPGNPGCPTVGGPKGHPTGCINNLILLSHHLSPRADRIISGYWCQGLGVPRGHTSGDERETETFFLSEGETPQGGGEPDGVFI